ncbi:MAG: AAA family ATPase [Planctomycetota bacterium]|jgi:uncharacterized protein YhaN
MKLERILVERYGAWSNLDLPVDSDGISVYYGPNEAGKSTLMRFIRGVLYGFRKTDVSRPLDEADDDASASWGGALQVEHQAEPWMVRRMAQAGSRGLLSAWRAEAEQEVGASDGSAVQSDIVGGVSEAVFENVFAIGLYELQELATLEDNDVAEHIYSLSLGLDGQQLLDLIEEVRDERSAILDPDAGTGMLADAHAEIDEIDQELEQKAGTRRKYEQLLVEQDNWEETIVELKQRQQGLEHQLRGHEYMERVHEPWLKVRQIERQLSSLPQLADFPESGLADLEAIETELSALKGRRNSLIGEAQNFSAQAKQIAIDPALRRYRPALQSFIDQREWIAELADFSETADEQAGELREQLDSQLEGLGNDWDVDRLRRVDVSHLSSNCLATRGREFQELERRNRRLQKRYRRLKREFHQRQDDVVRMRRQIGEGPVGDAIELVRDELGRLEDLSRLRVRERELTQRRIGIANQIHRLQIDPTLPEWVYAVFWAIAVCGFCLGLFGIWTGLTTNALSGTCYALVGSCSVLMTYGLKNHFENQVEMSRVRLGSELREVELRLAETKEAIERAAPTMAALQVGAKKGADDLASKDQAAALRERFADRDSAASWLSDVDLLRQCLTRLRDLEEMAEAEVWVEDTRERLIEMRKQLAEKQRDFGAARQNWCSQLSGHGLDETVEVDSALSQRDRVAQAAVTAQRIDALEEDAQVARRMLERFRKRVEEQGHRLDRYSEDYSDPLAIIDGWEEELDALSELMTQRRQLRREARTRRAEASKYRTKIRRLETRRDAILVRGGAGTREEFEERARSLEDRFELEDQLDRAKQELAAAAAGEHAMAIVESDLESYDEEQNRECIRTLRSELEDLAIDLEDAFENLGRFKRELELLASDRSDAELRFEREQRLSQALALAEKWFALEWSVNTLEELRIEFERNHQPPILNRAKEFLGHLSGGRYRNIWTPLGRRTLCVDDRDGNTLLVEHLSGGTREQLFLAIRFALIEHFTAEGAELPVVLDDVLVNFDEERTRAAIEELLKHSERDQQILYFTCHQHLAELFRQRGVSTVTLPDRRALANEKLAG